MIKFFIAFFCYLLLFFPIFGLIELEESQSDCVLGTRQIFIPNHPTAFNPSIVRWDGKILMSFRTRDAITHQANLIGLIYLDEHFHPKSSPQIIEIAHTDPEISYAQDPRLIVINKQLFMVYSDIFKSFPHNIRRMCIVELFDQKDQFIAGKPHIIRKSDFPLNSVEKNWVPFEFNQECLLSYSIFPHKVVTLLLGKNKCILTSIDEKTCQWDWGEIRGGTPALQMDHFYLGFFHSSKLVSSVESNGNLMHHYFMGAYTFESHYPFRVTRISKTPIIAKNFYKGKEHPTWKPLRAIFPCGYITSKKSIWVAYGRQDHEVWIVKLDKQKLLRNLESIK